MDKTTLKYILSAKFNFNQWIDVLREMFPIVDLFSQEHPISHSFIKSGVQVGTIRLDDGRSLAIYTFEVNDNVLIDRNRKGLREIAAKTIDQSITHGALAFYYSKNISDYRLTFIAKQSSLNENGELINSETAPKRYTFLLGENEPCRTATDRIYELISKKKNSSIYLADVMEAFSVERLNKEFFNGYKAQYTKFLKLLSDTKQNRDYVKKLLGRLVFLQFLQKKGWMGVPASRSDWKGGDKNYLSNLIARYEGNDRLLSDVLEVLFFNTLNEKREGDIADILLGDNIKIPYLNGGLFDKDKIDALDIDFPYSYFKELMDFFSMYNFTIDENDPEDSEIGIDPEMLGHIFENLLEDNKDKGAFYTPKEIVQYMCRQSVIQYLKTHTESEFHPAVESLISSKKVNETLQEKENALKIYGLLKSIKVCDPAIGSGAFPMGILNVLFHARQLLYGFTQDKHTFSHAEVKREIIQENIFGVDIEQGAVDIARLRFWLALVVDEEIPQPLPNLDYKIVCGNSIMHRFSLDTSIDKVFIEYNKNKSTNEQMSIEKYKEKVYEFTNTSDHKKKNEFRNTIENIKNAFRTQLSDWEKTKRRKLREQIRDLEMPLMFGKRTKEEEENLKKLKKALSQAEKEKNDLENNKIYGDSFEWRFEFPALLNNEGDFIGFDIIIGNPPFGAKLSSDEKKIYKEYYSDVHMRTPETYCYFISLAFRLANTNGIVSYIVPNNMFFQNENEKTRSLLLFSHRLIRAINLGDNTFENADVPTCIFIASSKKQENYEVEYSDYRKYNIRDIKWDKNYESIPIELIKTVPAYVLGLSSVNIRIINEIKQHGVLIDSIAEEMASGISTGGDNIFKVNQDIINSYHIENKILFPVIVGSNIDKYIITNTNEYIIYTNRDINIDDYPNIKEYLLLFIDKLKNRSEAKKGTLPWFSLNRNRYKQLFEEPKIIMRQTSDSIRCVYDDSSFYVLDSILVLKKNTAQYCYKYIATVLNSTLIDYLYKNLTQEEGRTFAQVKPINVRKLYIPKATKEEQKLLSTLYDYLVFLKNPKQTDPIISINSMFIDLFEKIVDGCVYELFFREHMKEREIDIMSYLYQKIKSIDGLSDKDKNNTIISVHSDIFMTDNPVRTRLKLFVSRSQEFLKPIIQH